MTNEIPLSGGRTTDAVVRIGATVRRRRKPTSTFVASLLQHLDRVDFDGAPRFLGVDEHGRDILSFIAGDVPDDLGWHADHVLIAAANLIRRYHDATTTLIVSPAAQAEGIEVVCHNDLSPCNAVFRQGLPVALIDFDAAAPGTRLHDLGYAIWLWLDIGRKDVDCKTQFRRLQLFTQAYGFDGNEAHIIDAVLTRQKLLIDEGQSLKNPKRTQWAADCRQWTLDNLVRPK
jgi:hypothetical protein